MPISGMAQCLPSEGKVLNSNPNTAQDAQLNKGIWRPSRSLNLCQCPSIHIVSMSRGSLK
jgi:hypothetical protein